MIEPSTPPAKTPAEQTRYAPAAFAVLSLAIVFMLYQIVGGGITLLLAGGSITQDNVMLARASTMAAQFLFLLLPTLWLVRKQHGTFSAVLQWRRPSLNEVVLSIFGMIALLQAAEGYLYFQGLIPLPEKIVPYIESVKKMIEETYRILVEARTYPELLFVILVVSVTPSFCEEVLFRGLVQKNFSLALNPRRGFIVTGIIFGLYHFNPFHAVPLIALGIYFGFLQYRSRTLIIPILAHFVNNSFSVTAAYAYGFSASDMPSIMYSSADEADPVTVLLTSLFFMVIFFIMMKMYVRSTEGIESAVPAGTGSV
jgi:hypothetical protein